MIFEHLIRQQLNLHCALETFSQFNNFVKSDFFCFPQNTRCTGKICFRHKQYIYPCLLCQVQKLLLQKTLLIIAYVATETTVNRSYAYPHADEVV